MWPEVSSLPPVSEAAAAYRSLGRLRPYRGGDLEQPGELRKAVEARSYNNELILTYGNEAGTSWIANLIFSLRAVGIEHFLVIVMSPEHCRALMRPPWRISCAWSSWDFGGCKRKMEMRRLWYARHHYMSRVIEEHGGVNVAVLDGDISVRADFYAAMKAPPLRDHNLIYTLDHSPSCGDLNVGFAYCQGCAPRGRAQWVLDEGLRREGYFCGGDLKEFGDGGRFWNASDASGASSGPHRWMEWTTARDQKLYSDIVAGACCGAPQHKLLFPSSHKVLDQYAFMRQWGQRAKCGSMAREQANGLQTWWKALLQGGGETPNETVAVATGALASGWHGTGAGELAGWSGQWLKTPPAIAHFVGGAPAGGKVDIMQGLGWWFHEADVVAHAISEETGKSAGLALPRSYFSARTQRGVLALAGPAATIRTATKEEFTERFVKLRWWLLQIAALLQRTAVDPQPSCNSRWIISDRETNHRGGYRGHWYTPGWPWPFKDGVGVVVGNCSYPDGTTAAAASTSECCSAIFGPIKGVKCMQTAHHMLLENALATPEARREATELPLHKAYFGTENFGGVQLDAKKLIELGELYGTQQVLFVRPPSPDLLPPIRGLSPQSRAFIGELLEKECIQMNQTLL